MSLKILFVVNVKYPSIPPCVT